MLTDARIWNIVEVVMLNSSTRLLRLETASKPLFCRGYQQHCNRHASQADCGVQSTCFFHSTESTRFSAAVRG
jgi:hypothetical protein